jgi:2-oxoglutarate dehydrogenase E2 component (dihydrolipoamide succinyltransferase)
MITSPASQENMDSQSGALANIVELARLSRLTLLYHGAAASAADGGREQAAALASAAGAEGEVVVLFDAGSDLPVPDLLADIEAAVLEAAPQAPLAPPMAGPVEALAFWQQALGIRFLLLMFRFDRALSRQDPEFDEVLLKLANDPLDISLLLLMDETAAPLLQRLRDALPELGETFLRLPEPAAPAPARAPAAAPPSAPALLDEPAPASTPMPAPAPAAQFGPSPFLFDDPDDDFTEQAVQFGKDQDEITPPAMPEPPPGREEKREETQQEKPAETQERRRSRRFSTLLEQASVAPEAFEPPGVAVPEPFIPPPDPFPAAAPAAPAPALAPLQIYPASAPPTSAMPDQALPDGRAEPSFQAAPPARPAASAASARVYRERRPMQVAAWMQKRRSRRRRDIVGIASRVGSSSTVLFVLMVMLAVLGWQMPQLAPPAPARAAPRAAAPQASPQASQAVALRGNR